MQTQVTKPCVGSWTLLNNIGSGGNSTYDRISCSRKFLSIITNRVFKAQHQESGEIVALKIFNLTDGQDSQEFKTEANLLESLKHPNIIKFISFEENLKLSNLKENPEPISALCMEYAAGGELFKVFQDLGSISETIVRTFFSQVLSAVEHLHSKRIAHMDIKLENLLLSADDTLKLADFGSAIKISCGQKCQGLTGTLRYLPPEALEGKPYDPFGTDLFALGIMLFTLVIGSLPFGQADRTDPFYGLVYLNEMTEFWHLHKENAKDSGKAWKTPSKDFKDLFSKLIHPDPSQRCPITEILKHSWMALGAVDAESLSFWMKTKKRILIRAKTLPALQKKI